MGFFEVVLDRVRNRLQYIPISSIIVAIIASQLTLALDAQLDDGQLPRSLETTVGSGRAILSAIAGGLISSVTLLLSLLLVAVQLASSQFSPRTLRNWISDRTQQVSIGIVLGTVVYCLLILRETRTFGEGEALTPHISVIVAVVFGIVSLIAVVRSVDHLTDRLRIGSVASMIMRETVSIIERNDQLRSLENPSLVPAAQPTPTERREDPPPGAMPVVSPGAGWVQGINIDAIIEALPDGSTAYVTTSIGSFAFPQAPVVWVWPPPEDEGCRERILAAIRFGDSRTMQNDAGFGIVQMVDIALRALSPGVNDPNTANDLIVHIGVVLLALWERPVAETVREVEGRKLIRHDLSHSDYLHAAFDPLRVHGAGDPQVAAAMIRTLSTLHTETRRRELPGPIEPIEETIEQLLVAVGASDVSDYDRDYVRRLVPEEMGLAASG